MRLPSPREPNTLHRRAVLQTLVSALLASPSLPALAAYTIVPSGSIAEKQSRMKEVEKLFEKNKDDPYAFGEKAQLEYDIAALEKNRDYVKATAAKLDAGELRFCQRLTFPVPNMAEAVNFWTAGCGALILETAMVDGANVTRVGFGPESLRKDDGAKFSLEMVEAAEPSRIGSELAVVQYVQLAMPVFRLSRVMAAGGEINSAYGWTDLVAPGGLPLRVKIDETRRDPFEFVAMRTNNLEKTKKHYEALGMAVQQVETGKRKIQVSINSNSIFENTDPFEPERDKGSVLMGFDDRLTSAGVLLLPPKTRKALEPVPSAIALNMVGAPAAPELGASPDGLRNVFVGLGDFESRLPTAGPKYVKPLELL